MYKFANVFAHSVRGLFILLVISLTDEKIFSLMWSYLFIFALVPLCLSLYIYI